MEQKLYGLIGAKLGHSYSKIIHEQLAGYQYELIPLPTEAEARAFMEKRAFTAINVTIPYKQLVIPYCDVVDPKAKEIGAVNTIVNRDGKLYGYNTDYTGFSYLARVHGVDFADKTVLILGTGGTHSTVEAVCRDGGAKEILSASRTGKYGALTYNEAMRRRDVQIIVNTTPCGMYPNVGQCMLAPTAFPELEAVLDVVYNPFRTELLLRAEEHGAKTAGGFEMLVAQAVYAAQYFTGRFYATDSVIPTASRRLQHQLANISLIGMPGCGKSTIGAALAKRLNKTFVDLDEEIERRTGNNIPDIFAHEGEEAFRRYEAETLADIGKRTGQVIACGGGIIKTPANVHAMRQNGCVLWVQRPLGKLATGGRPLSQGGAALKQLQAERTPLYRAAAHAVLDNSSTLANAVQAAVQLFESDTLL
ncbi:MAG TPA: shikimate dehydrogenase [Candidatus Gemmiger excrementigallinarum]|uniref:Shikimate kinase n=1 Tax=Candidatus Gemmiger excrementigallinarum TaxID=2838609 RepID=A0A9D2JA84_9FIRM|nr:shikimate dehydrogenase [Candidatus Gemmiger excrementigallinarum]